MIKKYAILYAPEAPVATGAPPVATTAKAAPEPSKVAPESSNEHSGGVDDFDALDARWDASNDEPAPKKEPEVKEPPVKEPPTKVLEAKVEPPKEPVKPAAPVVDDLNSKTPKQLRERLQAIQAERDNHAKKVAEQEKKIADLEARGIDATKATERLAALEKERDDYKGQLRAAKFEASDDFKKNFEAPFNEMAKDAQADITQLQISEQVDAEGNVTPARAATWKDFTQLYAMDRVTARATMKRAFGEDAGLVMEHYDALKRLDRQRGNALEKEQAEWSDRAKSEQTNREKQQQFIAATWTRLNQEIAEKPENAEWMKPDPTKPEQMKMLQESAALVDAKPQTLENKILHDAHVRQRAIAHPLLKHEIKTLRAENASLKATIAELRDSDPLTGKTRRTGEDGQSSEKTEEQELQEILNAN